MMDEGQNYTRACARKVPHPAAATASGLSLKGRGAIQTSIAILFRACPSRGEAQGP
jgi:hypothetical protein